MNNLFLVMKILCVGILMGGCSIESSRTNIHYPTNTYQKPFPHRHESAPLSRHDQRWNPQLADW